MYSCVFTWPAQNGQCLPPVPFNNRPAMDTDSDDTLNPFADETDNTTAPLMFRPTPVRTRPRSNSEADVRLPLGSHRHNSLSPSFGDAGDHEDYDTSETASFTGTSPRSYRLRRRPTFGQDKVAASYVADLPPPMEELPRTLVGPGVITSDVDIPTLHDKLRGIIATAMEDEARNLVKSPKNHRRISSVDQVAGRKSGSLPPPSILLDVPAPIASLSPRINAVGFGSTDLRRTENAVSPRSSDNDDDENTPRARHRKDKKRGKIERLDRIEAQNAAVLTSMAALNATVTHLTGVMNDYAKNQNAIASGTSSMLNTILRNMDHHEGEGTAMPSLKERAKQAGVSNWKAVSQPSEETRALRRRPLDGMEDDDATLTDSPSIWELLCCCCGSGVSAASSKHTVEHL